MSGQLERLFYRITGNRPMKFVTHCFTDVVNGQAVNLYLDKAGNHWLAHGPWARFRVFSSHHECWTDRS